MMPTPPGATTRGRGGTVVRKGQTLIHSFLFPVDNVSRDVPARKIQSQFQLNPLNSHKQQSFFLSYSNPLFFF
jgi:hypothetical protein